MDMVLHGQNGWMVNSEDVNGLATYARYVYEHQGQLNNLLASARSTAEANSYETQVPLWQKFMKGFVE